MRVASVKALFGPHGRIGLLQKLTDHLLWRLPDPESYLEQAPPLPQPALTNARLYTDRTAMLHALPKGGTVAEVGTWRGDFSKAILAVCKPETFHLIDVDFSPLDPSIPGIRHQGDSSTILKGFPEASLDWAYIDGDHSYAGVMKDLEAAHRALKPGGYLMCNDYTNWCSRSVTPYGVARAVNEFIIREGYLVEGLALHPAGLPDLLIRKP